MHILCICIYRERGESEKDRQRMRGSIHQFMELYKGSNVQDDKRHFERRLMFAKGSRAADDVSYIICDRTGRN